SGIISPAHNLRKPLDSMDLGTRDSSRNDYFISFRIVLFRDQRQGSGCSDLPVRLVVVANPDHSVVRNAKVNRGDWPLAAALEFAQPLVRHIEIPRHRHGKNAGGKTSFVSRTRDPVTQNTADVLLRREVDEESHKSRFTGNRLQGIVSGC